MTVIESFKQQSQEIDRSERILLTASQALIKYLSMQKVELFDGSIAPLFGGIWGIFGHGNVAGIGQAIYENDPLIPFLRGQNEQGMAHAAIAYAKANRCRRVMAVTTSIGPGATNLLTSAALAHINRLPVLLIPGDIFASRRPDPVLQQLEDEKNPNASVNDCFYPVSRYYDRLYRPEQLLYSLPFAIQTLLNPLRRGPVVLAFPQDVQTETYSYPLSFFQEKIHYIERQRADVRKIKEATKVIKLSKRPLIIAGGGVHYSGAEKTLKAFAENHGIPICETQAGKGSLPWDHALNSGAIGVTGSSSANTLARDSDLILCIGTRLSDFTTASKSLFHDQEKTFIGVNISPFDAIKGGALELIGDAKIILEELTESLRGYCTSSQYHEKIIHEKAIWEIEHDTVTQYDNDSHLPTDAQVLSVVNAMIDQKDIVVCAAGGLPGELHKHWHTVDPIGYHLEYGYSCMGYEIAGGLGVKIAYPDREVYVLVGDGSYLMMHSELLTSLQLGLKINVIVLDNQGFGCINRLQKMCGSQPFGNLFSKTSKVRMDFVKNAQSYGCYAKKVAHLEELKSTLIETRELNVSNVIVIDTDPQKSSPGYAWWDVAISGYSIDNNVTETYQKYTQKLKKLKWRS